MVAPCNRDGFRCGKRDILVMLANGYINMPSRDLTKSKSGKDIGERMHMLMFALNYMVYRCFHANNLVKNVIWCLISKVLNF